MEQKQRTKIIAVAVIMIIVSAGIGILSGSSDKGTTNTIEFVDTKNVSAITKFEEGLEELLAQGYLDAATRDIALAAGRKYDAEVISKSATPVKIITLSALKSNNMITAEMYDTLKTALDKQASAIEKEKFNPLVTSGAFTDIDKVEMVYNSFLKQYKDISDEQKKLMNAEIESANPPLTDAEKQKKTTEFKTGQEQRIDSVLSKMVSTKEISKIQADALKGLISK